MLRVANGGLLRLGRPSQLVRLSSSKSNKSNDSGDDEEHHSLFSAHRLKEAANQLTRTQMMQDMRELYHEMERRRYSARVWLASMGAVVLLLSYGWVKDWMSSEAADVTRKYLQNPNFQRDAVVFVQDIVRHEHVQREVESLLRTVVLRLSKDEVVKSALEDLFVQVFQTQGIKNAGAELSHDVLRKLAASSEVREVARRMVTEELNNIVTDQQLQQNVGKASWNVLKSWVGLGSTSTGENKTNNDAVRLGAVTNQETAAAALETKT